MGKTHTTLAIITLLMIAGFALRLYNIDAPAFRGDEAFTVLNWVRQPLADTLSGSVPTSDPQPPLAYALFRVWGLLLGESEFSMRLLPALTNLLGIPVMYALGRRVGGWMVGIIGAFLWMCHPFQIWHAQDARNYAIWAAFSLIALWLALRAITCRRPLDWLLYVAAASIAAYVYYLELFILFTLNLYVLYLAFLRHRTDKKLLVLWFASQFVIGLVLAPWFLQERLLVSSGYGGTAGGFNFAQLFTWFLPTLTFGSTIPDTLAGVIWPFIVVILVAGVLALWQTQRQYAVLLSLLIVIPSALLALVSTRLDVFSPRYIMGIIPALILLVSVVIVTLLTRSRYGKAIAWAVMGVILLGNSFSLYNHFRGADYTKYTPWREITAYLHTHVSPDDMVIQSSSDIAFTLYYGDFTAIRYLPANPNQPVSEIQAVLANSLDEYRSFWVIGQPASDWPNAPARDEWLNQHMQRILSTAVDGLAVRHFMPWQVDPAEIEPGIQAAFDDTVQLIHTHIIHESDITVWAYWQPLKTTTTPLKVFLHLVDTQTGVPLSQDDRFPQDGRISTANWSAAEVYRDVYTLTIADVPSGTYHLLIGLYEPDTGQRLLLSSGDDSYTIGTITLP